MTSNKKGVQQIVNCCRKKGITKVVFSPGSRSAPLVLAFSAIPEIECIVLPDERVAGYFALGMAQQLQQTVAVVCTSGTAVTNLMPAVCEAYYQHIPLLILTADRPEGAVNKGENQAIMQADIFGVHTVFTAAVNGDADTESELIDLQKSMATAIDKTTQGTPGPAHINVHVSEPLYQTTETPLKHVDTNLQKISTSSLQNMDLEQLEHIKTTFTRHKQKMIIVGMQAHDSTFNHLLEQLSQFSDTIIVYEAISNINIQRGVYNIDACLSLIGSNPTYVPDLVITLGKQIVSKKIKQFLLNKPQLHWDIPPTNFTARNWAMFGSIVEEINPVNQFQFLQALRQTLPDTDSNFQQLWIDTSLQAETLSQQYLHTTPFCDITIFETVLASLPEVAHIQYGNSTPIRYGNLFKQKAAQRSNSNRGTSGIDGCLSTATGAAYVQGELTVCILGDISFFYDSNALWNNYLSPDLRIILINNSGGNIFRLIDGPDQVPNFEKFFETQHTLNAKHLAAMHNLPYFSCNNQTDLQQILQTFYEPDKGKPVILEIKTDNQVSAQAFKNYFSHLSNHKK